MKVMDHPYLEGVKCREDGAVWVPAGRRECWTFGFTISAYRAVAFKKKNYYVHRLICEAFHGKCPEGKSQVDHLDRDPSNNRPENLRWVSPSENCRNRVACVKGMGDAVSQRVDKNAYQRALYAANPKNKELHLRHARS